MSNSNEITDLLGSTRLFGSLDADCRAAIAKDMRPVSFSSGEAIFSRGDEGKELYLVLKGRVRLSVLSLDGRELSFSHAAQGDVFGEIATLDGDVRTADATAVGKVQAMSLSRAALNRHIETMPALALAAIAFLCGRIREADQQLEGVALHRIEVRLSRYILGLVAQHGDDADADGRKTVDLGMSQGELSLLLGASRPKVNAALMMLEDSGAIERSGTKVICAIDELKAIAEVE